MKNIVLIIVVIALAVGAYMYFGNTSEAPTDTMEENDEMEMMEEENVSAGGAATGGVERNADGAYVVRYTNAGFSPFLSDITRGDSVVFINESNNLLQVTTEGFPTEEGQSFPGFDNSKVVEPGEEWGISITANGTFGYKNSYNEAHTGAIAVQPQ